MIFTHDLVTREKHLQIASLLTPKSLFTVTLALFFMYRLWLHGLYGRYGSRCPLSPERPDPPSRPIDYRLCGWFLLWPWPWIFKVKYGICSISDKNDLIATKWKANIFDLDPEFARSNINLLYLMTKWSDCHDMKKKIEFYLKSTTGKSYSNIKIAWGHMWMNS